MSKIRDSQFRKGDRVESTSLAIQNGVFRDAQRGVVVGYSRKIPYLVRVLRDGIKRPDSYHEDFWRPEAYSVQPPAAHHQRRDDDAA